MALVSPGVEITVTDESQYLPSAVGTVPFIVVATAENKTINGVVAPGTTKANAGKAYGITSQRELATTFGTPTFRRSSADTPLHGDELNEYGLMAAYSALGLGNRAWVVRADIDLNDLVGSSVRPTGTIPNGINWLDYDDTSWGIFEFDTSVPSGASPFVAKPISHFINSSTDLTANSAPLDSIGTIGDYAAVVVNNNNLVYKKLPTNSWAQVGSTNWINSIPNVTGTKTLTSTLTGNITLDGTNVALSSSNIDAISTAINAAAITNVTSSVTTTGRLTIKTTNANVVVAGDSAVLTALGITAKTYKRAELKYGSYAQQPAFLTEGNPNGSVWLKTGAEGAGANFVLRRYNATTLSFVTQPARVFEDGFAALHALDPTGGGINIAANSAFIKHGTTAELGFRLFTQRVAGQTVVVGGTSLTITNGAQFRISVSQPGSATPITSATLTVNGTTANAFVEAFTSAGIPNAEASSVGIAGPITIRHRTGGIIKFENIANCAPSSLGFTTSISGFSTTLFNSGDGAFSNFSTPTYTASANTPTASPDNGQLWYYNDPTAIDIMIADSTVDGTTGSYWKGYRQVSSDIRGYNLANTDPEGVIISAARPTKQTNSDPLVSGDLWLDTSDLENFPRLYRYDSATTTWNLIDNTDHVSQNGIIFADARWGTSLSVDPISDALPTTKSLLSSNYIDPDCPDSRLFPPGTLLFNTRRSGYNVKKFVSGYFNNTAFPNAGLGVTTRNAWVTQIGYNDNLQPMMGHFAQRNEIIQAMRAAIDSNLDLREEGYNYNLLTAPGYPELIPNLIALNNDRANTGFIIGDTPMTMPALVANINSFSASQSTASPYVGIYYPSALTNDLSGNEIAVPASHMMLRTFIYNDNVSYQWFAPAGTRRGLIDNARAIGYVNANTGNFVITGINNSLRDALYETRINPITLINGVGIVAYGQKTRSAVISGAGSSLDRVNVARLVNYLRTVLQGVANQFLFEPNDKITRDQVKNLCESVMNDLIAKRGLYDYIVVCDESNNTSDRIARNELYVDIAVEPSKAVEFIYIPIRLRNPGTITGSATTAATV
jgi:hypothetical protein